MTHLSKPIESTTSKVNPNVNYRFWVIMTCQYRYPHCNKGTILVGHVDNEGDCILWSKCIWETLYFLLNFAKAKPALKNSPKTIIKVVIIIIKNDWGTSLVV